MKTPNQSCLAVPDELMTVLTKHGQSDAEAIVHALTDIAESVDTVYRELLPKLLATLDRPHPEFQDALWDIREEFRHVAYHMEDAKLTEL